MYSCSIIIVAYNSCDFIPACLKSIRDACENVDAQVIVLDNGSESPILPEIKAFFPEVQWIDSKVNLGFGKGCNLAEKQATKPYLFFINPDTVVSRDSFTKVLDFMEEHPESGTVGCRILNEDGSIQWACRRSFPTPISAISKTIGLASFFPKSKLLASYNMTYADPDAEALTGTADIRRPDPPAPLLPHSYASASVVTDIIVKKYADALPLYRQEQMWKRLGVELKRNTMAHWIVLTAETYLKPFSDAFLSELLRQAVIHADETVLQVNKEPGREATAESRIWAYASSKRAERQIRYFRYEESRKGACAEKVLGDYSGTVISDGYSGYNILSKAVRAGCWAHARRKWVEAMPEGATKENALAAKGLEYCSQLFEVEKKLEGLPDAERRERRQLLSKPIVDAYYAWLETIFKPAGKLKKAITYSLNQREFLCAFLDHGEIEISNNQVENAIRPIVVGRKNWLFCDTQAGANASVIVFTVLETAKANGLNPETYLNHLLTVLPERFATDPQAAVDDLLPWTEKMQISFRVSTVEH